MKAADMYMGMEVAVKRCGYERPMYWTKATIVQIVTGGGHAAQHVLKDEDGSTFYLHARRIMEPWSEHWAKHGETIEAVQQSRETAAFKAKLQAEYKEIQRDQASRIVDLFRLLGIDAVVVDGYGWKPGVDDSFAFSITIKHLDRIQALLEPLVQQKYTAFLTPNPTGE
jgi:hypothetical protein